MANKNKSRSSQPSPQTGEKQPAVSQRPAHIASGDDTRGSVNSRSNQTETQPEPSPGTIALGSNAETIGKVVALRVPKGEGFIGQIHVEMTEGAAEKVQQFSAASQKLAEAADLSEEGELRTKEAREASDAAAILLYQLRVAGQASADEVSSLLGDKFGYRVKGGTEKYVPGASGGAEISKTPYGAGEAIRKRIVRAVQAHEFVNGGDGGRFFSFPEDAVAGEGQFEGMSVPDILAGMEKGTIGFWAAYEAFGAIKRNATVRADPAFDPKKVAALAEALQEEGAAKQFVDNRALQEAYTALHDMILVINDEVAALQKVAA